jgi:anti-anti-sigma regulatory factor
MPFALLDKRCRMMRITVLDGKAELRLMVEGKLTGPYIPELESAWNQARQEAGRRPIVVDLSGVSSIDPAAEAALTAMVSEGARLRAKGLYFTCIAKRLMNRARKERTRRDGQDRARVSSSIKKSSRASQRSPGKETY